MRKLYPWLVLSFVVFLILGPIYRSGQLFLLDLVWGNRLSVTEVLSRPISSTTAISLLIAYANQFLSLEIIQKILLTAVLYVIPASMFIMARRFMPTPYAFLAGMMYVCNPFVYERFLAGQWIVLAGYGFFPLVMSSIIELFQHPNKRNAITFSILFAIYPLISLHWSYIAAGTSLLYTLFVEQKYRPTLKQLAACLAVIICMFIVLNFFWLVHFWEPHGTFANIRWQDFAAFQTEGDPTFGRVFNIVSLYGFWQSEHLLPKDVFPGWWLASIGVMVLAVIGWIRLCRLRYGLALFISTIFIVAIVVALGYASPITRPFVHFVYLFIPGFAGLRETAKVIGLIAWCYAITVPLAVEAFIMGMVNRYAKVAVACALISVPFLTVPTIWWGFDQQINPHTYPSGWYVVNEHLNVSKSEGQTLFYPWHGYMRFAFSDNYTIANPASVFFDNKIIQGRLLDNVFLEDAQQPEWDDFTFKLLNEVSSSNQEILFLANENVSYIILSKNADWLRYYSVLKSKGYLERVYEDKDIVLFKLKTN